MKIAVDVMGTDYGPGEIVTGAVNGANAFGCEVVLVGDKEKIEKVLSDKKFTQAQLEKVSIEHADDVIEMNEHPSVAVRRKKTASVVVAAKLLKDSMCNAVISPGSTGAAVAAALLVIGRIPGVERPTITTPIPNQQGTTILLDSGANVDSKPHHLVQAAIMGSLYAEHVLRIPRPKVGLLNIGEEESKGNEQVLATYPLLKETKEINFIGNAEGRDITNGKVDVVVCDGFVGNVILKFAEGLSVVILNLIKDAIKSSGFFPKIAAALLLPALGGLKKKLDVAEYGGAPLLGIDGTFIICHGSSKAKEIYSAIRVAVDFDKSRLLDHIREAIKEKEEKV